MTKLTGGGNNLEKITGAETNWRFGEGEVEASKFVSEVNNGGGYSCAGEWISGMLKMIISETANFDNGII